MQTTKTNSLKLLTVAILLAAAVATGIWTAKGRVDAFDSPVLSTPTGTRQWFRICPPVPTGPAPTYTPNPTPTCYPASTPYPTSTPYPHQPDNPEWHRTQ